MKKTHILFSALAALAALPLFGACSDKEVDPLRFDRFTLHTRVSDAHPAAAKTSWDPNGLWWDEGDAISVNDKKFAIGRNEEGKWVATSEEGGVAADGSGNFNICYPATGDFDLANGDVPLASVTASNNVTLNPCCAVIRVANGGASFCMVSPEDGEFYSSGSIDIASQTIVDGNSEAYFDAIFDGDYAYFILPMSQSSVTASLDFDFGSTNGAVEIKKGYLYTIDPDNL